MRILVVLLILCISLPAKAACYSTDDGTLICPSGDATALATGIISMRKKLETALIEKEALEEKVRLMALKQKIICPEPKPDYTGYILTGASVAIVAAFVGGFILGSR